MEKQKSPLVIILVLLGVVGVIVAYSVLGSSKMSPVQATPSPSPTTVATSPVVCTMEAKLCPDGSAVGRVGPRCEFAACPTPTSNTTLELHLGQSKSIQGVTIAPLAVTQDSRCPVNVTCIWAGTVDVRTRVTDAAGASDVVFSLNSPVAAGGLTITLTKVSPEKHEGVTLKDSDYVFTFTVTEK